MIFLPALLAIFVLTGCVEEEIAVNDLEIETVAVAEEIESKDTTEVVTPVAEPEEVVEVTEEVVEETVEASPATTQDFGNYTLVNVDGGDLSGTRQANVVVDIGFGDREYWAFTNEHGQLVRVTADQITLQDDSTEPVKSTGRYYSDEAKVPGVESDKLDEGHVIADSLGGVSNAYNITPQESTLNRHGDQAYMEKVIRDAGGAANFEAIITYPNTETQIPSSYQYTYTVNRNKVVDKFDNANPDEVNASLGLTDSKPKESTKPSAPAPATPSGDVSKVDANGNGKVTIQEAKDAGFKMPIMSDHWLYQYMQDNDGDGMVGE